MAEDNTSLITTLPICLYNVLTDGQILLQLCLLEGISFEQKELEVGPGNVSELDLENMLLLDNTNSSKAEPLLVPGKGCPGEHTVDHKLVVPLQAGCHPLELIQLAC